MNLLALFVFFQFTQSAVVETYIEFINNWKDARDAIKAISLAKPAFAKFLEVVCFVQFGFVFMQLKL